MDGKIKDYIRRTFVTQNKEESYHKILMKCNKFLLIDLPTASSNVLEIY